MIKRKCMTVDDEPHSTELLVKYINRTEGLELIAQESDAIAALNLINSGEVVPDILFLDVEMQGIKGTEFVKRINNKEINVIFCTGFPDFAVAGFETQAVGFIVKPISYDRFLIAVEKARLRFNETQKTNKDSFFAEVDGKQKLIRYHDVYYIEGQQNYVAIHLEKTKHLTYLRLKDIETKLPRGSFIRVQKSFIVNLDNIDFVKETSIFLTNAIEIQIGPTYFNDFMEMIRNRSINNGR